METPKVQFINIPLSKETDWIYGFLFKNKWGWGKHIIKKHPSIKNVLSLETETEQVQFLEEYIVQFRKNNQKLMEKNQINYQKEWQKIETQSFLALSEIMQIDWPKNKKIIKAMLSVNPICPRFLNNWSFSLFYNYKKISHAMEVIMHESCHFLYFEKWQQMYPEMSRKNFESPHLGVKPCPAG